MSPADRILPACRQLGSESSTSLLKRQERPFSLSLHFPQGRLKRDGGALHPQAANGEVRYNVYN